MSHKITITPLHPVFSASHIQMTSELPNFNLEGTCWGIWVRQVWVMHCFPRQELAEARTAFQQSLSFPIFKKCTCFYNLDRWPPILGQNSCTHISSKEPPVPSCHSRGFLSLSSLFLSSSLELMRGKKQAEELVDHFRLNWELWASPTRSLFAFGLKIPLFYSSSWMIVILFIKIYIDSYIFLSILKILIHHPLDSIVAVEKSAIWKSSFFCR